MFIAVSAKDLPRHLSVASAKRCGQDQKQCGKSRRDKIRDIIQMRRKPAKIHVLFILVAEHGIHRVDALVKESTGSACKNQKE